MHDLTPIKNFCPRIITPVTQLCVFQIRLSPQKSNQVTDRDLTCTTYNVDIVTQWVFLVLRLRATTHVDKGPVIQT